MSIQPVSMCAAGRRGDVSASLRSDDRNPEGAVERDYEEAGGKIGGFLGSSLPTGQGRDCNDHSYTSSRGDTDQPMNHGGSVLEWIGFGFARLFGWVRTDTTAPDVQRADAAGQTAVSSQPGDLAALPAAVDVTE